MILEMVMKHLKNLNEIFRNVSHSSETPESNHDPKNVVFSQITTFFPRRHHDNTRTMTRKREGREILNTMKIPQTDKQGKQLIGFTQFL